ncbi:hypothetical protein [Eubacterium ventriosum]|jgi:hypothetical protein|uniref:hypothetical protein n=1 Tax=Eubacterium ventriosum TaxID=39496 RepID=UPI001A9A420A|nr:hypothetical protein [Eubacterium ventriosum]
MATSSEGHHILPFSTSPPNPIHKTFLNFHIRHNPTTSLPPFTTRYQENPNTPIKQGKEQCKTIKKGVAIIPEIV